MRCRMPFRRVPRRRYALTYARTYALTYARTDADGCAAQFGEHPLFRAHFQGWSQEHGQVLPLPALLVQKYK
jgi:hypothetical protein